MDLGGGSIKMVCVPGLVFGLLVCVDIIVFGVVWVGSWCTGFCCCLPLWVWVGGLLGFDFSWILVVLVVGLGWFLFDVLLLVWMLLVCLPVWG